MLQMMYIMFNCTTLGPEKNKKLSMLSLGYKNAAMEKN